MAQNFEQFSQSDSRLLTIKEAADFLRISRRSLFYLISNGRLQTVKLSPRTTRISLKELQRLTEATFVAPASPFPPFNNDKREKKKPDVSAKPETGNVNKRAKCRMTPASDIAPEGVTHDSHYTLAEVMRKFGIKYGRFYEVRNRFQLPSVHAWGTTAFRKEDVENAIAKYNEEQGKAQTEAYYTCFDIMQKYGLGKTQVRRFAETHGVRIKKAKGGRANLYLKADWEAARKKAEKTSRSTKAKRT
ncbi:MAG: helix-turn-helix domain-containing protein [Bacteroidaceae bacterium]|nr:helix-turn-helix domain-containing protein [Bacteroidaceae bacterium]